MSRVISGWGTAAVLLCSLAATPAAADVLAVAPASVEVASAPVRVSLNRKAERNGEPAALVLSDIEVHRGRGAYNVFLAAPQTGGPPRGAESPDYIGTFTLFDVGTGSVVTLPVPPHLRAELGGTAPTIEIVPVGNAKASLTLGRVSLLGP